MKTIKINPEHRTFTIVVLLILFGVLISSVSGATIDIYLRNSAYVELEDHVGPGEWLCNKEMYSFADLNSNEYILYIKGLDGNLSISGTSNKTQSMFPCLSLDAKIMILEITDENIDRLQVGDIITFKKAGKTSQICHRIVNINDDGSFITKGDNNVVCDDVVSPEDVTGVVVGIIY